MGSPCLTCGHSLKLHGERLDCHAPKCECWVFDAAPYHPKCNPDPTRRFVESLLVQRGADETRAMLAEAENALLEAQNERDELRRKLHKYEPPYVPQRYT